MLLLLIILLALGASSLRGMNLFPLQFSKKGFAFLGWYPAFLVFSSCQFVFFMGDGLEDGVDQKAQWKGTCEMIWLSALDLMSFPAVFCGGRKPWWQACVSRG